MKRIETEIEINASPGRVWEVLTDFEAMPEWNPFIREITGELRPGERLRVTIQPPNGKAMTFKPTVLRAEANRELRWLGRLFLPKVFDGEHYFVIDELGDRGVTFTHGELFRGVLVPVAGRSLNKTTMGFAQMKTALKERAEMPA